MTSVGVTDAVRRNKQQTSTAGTTVTVGTIGATKLAIMYGMSIVGKTGKTRIGPEGPASLSAMVTSSRTTGMDEGEVGTWKLRRIGRKGSTRRGQGQRKRRNYGAGTGTGPIVAGRDTWMRKKICRGTPCWGGCRGWRAGSLKHVGDVS